MVISRKSLRAIVWAASWLWLFLHETPLSCGRTDIQITATQTGVFGRCFLKNVQSKTATSRKTTDSMIKYKLPVKTRILENISTTVGLAASQFSQIFLMRLVIFWCGTIQWQYLGYLHNLQKEQCMRLQNHTCIKDPFKGPQRPIDFRVTEYGKYWYGFRFHIATNL